MPVQPTYPGVYVQEVPSGVRTIVGVSTSVTMFVGRTKSGPLNRPVQILDYNSFQQTFSEDSSVGDLFRYVKLFFANGGTNCYVLRIAKDAEAAEVTLKTEGDDPSLVLKAKSPGIEGESVRARVTYAGPQPEHTFNIELFRSVVVGGKKDKADVELFGNLSMDPASPRYAPKFLTQNSSLVDCELAPGAPGAGSGFSLSGRPVVHDGTSANELAAWNALIGANANNTGKSFRISVDGSPYVEVEGLATLDVVNLNDIQDLPTEIAGKIADAFASKQMPGVTVAVSLEAGPIEPGPQSSLLKITSASGDVLILPSATLPDAAGPLMLGTGQGGVEIGAHAGRRPAPNGITLKPTVADLAAIGETKQQDVTKFEIDAQAVSPPPSLITTAGGDAFWIDAKVNSVNGNSDGIREKLALLRTAINDFAAANKKTFPWKAELWGYRLAVLPTAGEHNDIATTVATGAAALDDALTPNVSIYTVGVGGNSVGLQQNPTNAASDGTAPQLSDYDEAYEIIDRDVDLFNLLVLPPDADAGAPPQSDLWGPASVFCQRRRAFLLMDAPTDWDSAQKAADSVDDLRVGLVKDYAALFYPRVTINEDGLRINVGASGAIAGLMARIDSNRGVWKAAAGTEADVRGVVGLERSFSDPENGVMNPRAVNTLRVFPNGIVNWGARTMDGDDDFGSEYKYYSIRRTALFIEESLYRGLKWVVFEPNDEPLWAQIRLNVGAFMHNLFRQGAFQGQTPKEAYFVKCDKETTSQNDINLGIVNIWVGFAPLKPAEFVVLYLQQIAGEIAT